MLFQSLGFWFFFFGELCTESYHNLIHPYIKFPSSTLFISFFFFFFEVGDNIGSQRISRNDLTIMLTACTDMLKHFGDSEIHSQKITTLVESVFMESDRNAKDEVDRNECITVMMAHPIVTDFYESALDDAEYMMK